MKHALTSLLICGVLVAFAASASAQIQPAAQQQPQPKIQQVENALDYYAQYRTPPFIAANTTTVGGPITPVADEGQPITLIANPNYPYSAPRVYVPIYNIAPLGYYRTGFRNGYGLGYGGYGGYGFYR